jgi:hypothetical protein
VRRPAARACCQLYYATADCATLWSLPITLPRCWPPVTRHCIRSHRHPGQHAGMPSNIMAGVTLPTTVSPITAVGSEDDDDDEPIFSPRYRRQQSYGGSTSTPTVPSSSAGAATAAAFPAAVTATTAVAIEPAGLRSDSAQSTESADLAHEARQQRQQQLSQETQTRERGLRPELLRPEPEPEPEPEPAKAKRSHLPAWLTASKQAIATHATKRAEAQRDVSTLRKVLLPV